MATILSLYTQIVCLELNKYILARFKDKARSGRGCRSVRGGICLVPDILLKFDRLWKKVALLAKCRSQLV